MMTAPFFDEALAAGSAAISRLNDTGEVTALPGVVCAEDNWPWPRDVSEQANRRRGRKLGLLRGARWGGTAGPVVASVVTTTLFSEEDVAEDQDDRPDECWLSASFFSGTGALHFSSGKGLSVVLVCAKCDQPSCMIK